MSPAISRGTRRASALGAFVLVMTGCQSDPNRATLAQLEGMEPDLREVTVDESLMKAMQGYREFLEETPGHAMAPEAMRRLADLQLEKEFGVIGRGTDALPAPAAAAGQPVSVRPSPASRADDASLGAGDEESDAEFEARAAVRIDTPAGDAIDPTGLPDDLTVDVAGPRQAIDTYQRILDDYPWYPRNDQVLYQMARAYDELSQPEEAMTVIDRLVTTYPRSGYLDEVLFRRGEYHFVRRQYLDAERAYLAVVDMGSDLPFFEYALYKLGWALYKQEMYEEGLDHFIALLDHKLAGGYNFDTRGANEDDERRVSDTFRVISLSFSNLGDARELQRYFAANGQRSYEDRVYRNLAEFHVAKRRFNDAADVYDAFVEGNPFHNVSPHFGMRVAEIYAEGNFPLLVVDAKRDFASRYGIHADYWHHHDIDARADVVDYLKGNLIDLANHYHAAYQDPGLEDDRAVNYEAAITWYGEFLASFPQDDLSPATNYQLADLLLEHGDYGRASLEYERTAYDYRPHEQASSAGYAAVYAHREYLQTLPVESVPLDAFIDTVNSSLRFADAFPQHENAGPVLAAAVEDVFDMDEYANAVNAGRWLLTGWPELDAEMRRATWTIVAHSSFELERYPDAEVAYAEVLSATPADAEDHQAITDNLAAAIYKQGEQARAADDHSVAADHFLRLGRAAPGSTIRAAGEYDGAAALIAMEDWTAAGEVLERFRTAFPEHELHFEATRQLATVYENAGELASSADAYERVAAEAGDPEASRQALLAAGDLYEQAGAVDQALRVHEQYIETYPAPLDAALEIRNKVATVYRERRATEAYHDQLRAIVAVDGDAGAARSDRSRFLAAHAALVLSQPDFDAFTGLALVQPFEQSLVEKRRRMEVALARFQGLVDYEVAEVTAAATFYMAEVYRTFSSALMQSERPAGLSAAELAEYDMVIEEEAYPFEEQAIAVHQENIELIRVGVYNPWVERSLGALAELMPGRFAKAELSAGFIGTIDQYAYRAPAAPLVDDQALDTASTEARGTTAPSDAGVAPISTEEPDDVGT
jgi:tetratricopeptide (TPR) repeat protein